MGGEPDDDRALFERLMGAVPAAGMRPAAPADAQPEDDAALFGRLMGSAPQAGAQPAPAGARAALFPRTRAALTGMGDILHGGAQALAHALPTGAVEAVNRATAAVNEAPVIGPVTRALGMTPATPADLDQRVRTREQAYQAERAAGGRTGTDWWRMAGQVPAGMAATAALPAPASLPGAIGLGAASGAVQGALQPVTEGDDFGAAKRSQIGAGTVAGAAGGAGGYALGRMIAPRPSPEVRTLREAGVEMTPGQMAGGWAQRAEDRAASIPVLGDRIRAAQRNALESFNRAAANDVLAPIGQRLDRNAPVGRALVDDVEQRISAAYDAAVARARPFGRDAQFDQEILAAAQRNLLNGREADEVAQLMRRHVMPLLQGSQIDGAAYQTAKSELSRLAREYGGSAEPVSRRIGATFGDARRALQDLLARTNPDIAPELQAADAAFARFIRLQNAAGRVGATEGVFTPAQFSGAVRQSDRSLRHGAYARGDALMQDLSDAARSVLPQTVPNSGTTDRALWAMMALNGGAGLGAVNPLAAAAGTAAYGAYTRPAAPLMNWLMARNPSAAGGLLGDAVAGSGGAVAVPLGSLLLSPPDPRAQQIR